MRRTKYCIQLSHDNVSLCLFETYSVHQACEFFKTIDFDMVDVKFWKDVPFQLMDVDSIREVLNV